MRIANIGHLLVKEYDELQYCNRFKHVSVVPLQKKQKHGRGLRRLKRIRAGYKSACTKKLKADNALKETAIRIHKIKYLAKQIKSLQSTIQDYSGKIFDYKDTE